MCVYIYIYIFSIMNWTTKWLKLTFQNCLENKIWINIWTKCAISFIPPSTLIFNMEMNLYIYLKLHQSKSELFIWNIRMHIECSPNSLNSSFHIEVDIKWIFKQIQSIRTLNQHSYIIDKCKSRSAFSS